MCDRNNDENEGWVFMVGLIIVSISVGFLSSMAWGFFTFGVVLVAIALISSMLKYLDSGSKVQDVDKRREKG